MKLNKWHWKEKTILILIEKILLIARKHAHRTKANCFVWLNFLFPDAMLLLPNIQINVPWIYLQSSRLLAGFRIARPLPLLYRVANGEAVISNP